MSCLSTLQRVQCSVVCGSRSTHCQHLRQSVRECVRPPLQLQERLTNISVFADLFRCSRDRTHDLVDLAAVAKVCAMQRVHVLHSVCHATCTLALQSGYVATNDKA